MKYLVITDVHDDSDTLSFLIGHLDDEYDRYICLGDVVGNNGREYGSSRKCLQLLKDHHFILTLGNHDIYHLFESAPQLFNRNNSFCLYVRGYLLSKGWDYSLDDKREFTSSEMSFLSSQKTFYMSEGVLFSHFVSSDICGMRKTARKNSVEFFKLINSHFKHMRNNNLYLSFIGHAHVQNTLIVMGDTTVIFI